MLTVGSLFSGIGLLDCGLHLAGLNHAWFCEWQPERRALLSQRWPGAQILDDVRAVGANTVPRVDGVVGGFPCKGASTAGKRNGFDHAETVLWREMARAVGELRPRYVVVENVANILSLHNGAVWGEVLGDLATLGFDVEWDCYPAAAFGAPHLRDRVIAVATHPDRYGLREQPEPERRRGGPTVAGRPDAAPADATIVAPGEPPDQADALAGSRKARSIAGRGDGAAAPDPGQGRWQGVAAEHGPKPAEPLRHAERLGVSVEWGIYEPAIRRWETVHGAAPEPLCAFRGVDARDAAAVERSRLSALGDGVHVYLGRLIGEHLINLERERLSLAA